MRTTIPTFLLVAGLALTSFPSFAKDSPAERAPAAQAQRDLLAERSKVIERKIRRPVAVGGRGASVSPDLARRNRFRRQQREIDALIQRIEAGEEVFPGEVERLLEAR
jgi:hypothetical protein